MAQSLWHEPFRVHTMLILALLWTSIQTGRGQRANCINQEYEAAFKTSALRCRFSREQHAVDLPAISGGRRVGIAQAEPCVIPARKEGIRRSLDSRGSRPAGSLAGSDRGLCSQQRSIILAPSRVLSSQPHPGDLVLAPSTPDVCSVLCVRARNPVRGCSIMQPSRCRCPFDNDQTGLGDPVMAKESSRLGSLRLRARVL